MMKLKLNNSKYDIQVTSRFKNDFKKIKKQGKNIDLLNQVLEILASGKKLAPKYKDHELHSDKRYKKCRDCHIEPDWLLIYKIQDNKLILLLFATGSHSDLFR